VIVGGMMSERMKTGDEKFGEMMRRICGLVMGLGTLKDADALHPQEEWASKVHLYLVLESRN